MRKGSWMTIQNRTNVFFFGSFTFCNYLVRDCGLCYNPYHVVGPCSVWRTSQTQNLTCHFHDETDKNGGTGPRDRAVKAPTRSPLLTVIFQFLP